MFETIITAMVGFVGLYLLYLLGAALFFVILLFMTDGH